MKTQIFAIGKRALEELGFEKGHTTFHSLNPHVDELNQRVERYTRQAGRSKIVLEYEYDLDTDGGFQFWNHNHSALYVEIYGTKRPSYAHDVKGLRSLINRLEQL